MTSVEDQYEAVNGMLELLGGDPISMPDAGTPREKLQHLMASVQD